MDKEYCRGAIPFEIVYRIGSQEFARRARMVYEACSDGSMISHTEVMAEFPADLDAFDTDSDGRAVKIGPEPRWQPAGEPPMFDLASAALEDLVREDVKRHTSEDWLG